MTYLNRFVLFLCLISVNPDLSLSEELRGNLDLVTIVDLSKSMVGAGGTAKIFDRVQKSCKDIVQELKDHDSFTLITFGSKVKVYPTVTLNDNVDRERLFELIDDLKATENWTYTALSLKSGLEEAARLEKVFPDHKRVVLILTDGLNDPPPGARGNGPKLSDVATPYAGKGWFVYQVQYGATVDEDLDNAAKLVGPGGTISDRNAQGGIDKLRPIIQGSKKKTLAWKLDPDKLEITLHTPGIESQVSSAFTLPEAVAVSDIMVQPANGEIPNNVDIQAELVSTDKDNLILRVKARSEQEIPNGVFTGKLRISLKHPKEGIDLAPKEIPLILTAEMIPSHWPYWVGGAVLLLLAVFISMWGLRKWRAMSLFGRLVYWSRNVPEKKTTIDDISIFGRQVTIGSDKIPLQSVSNIASLKVQNVDGDNLVTVYVAEKHKLLYEARSMSELVLYDGDQFSVDEYEFKYSGATGRRPRK